MLMKGLDHKAKRTRYIQIGESAGKTVQLAASVLRSSGVEILEADSEASPDEIVKAVGDFFAEAAKKPFILKSEIVPLRDVEAAWNKKDEGVRVVFQP